MRRWRLHFIVVGLLLLGACGEAEDERPTCGYVAGLCSGDDTCIEGRCEEAFPREYDLKIRGLLTRNERAAGVPWDEDETLADPIIRVYHGAKRLCQAQATPNSNELSVVQSCAMSAAAPGEELLIEVWDDDGVDYELMFSCRAAVNHEQLRKRALECATQIGVVYLGIKPRGERPDYSPIRPPWD